MAKKPTDPNTIICLPIGGIGHIEENSLHLLPSQSKSRTVTLRTPGTIGKATNHQRQYVDILTRRTEEKTGVPLSVTSIVVPPSSHPTTIVLDVEHYRLLLLEAIEFPKNGKYAKGEVEKNLASRKGPKQPLQKKRRVVKKTAKR